jgi:acyl-CoA synthetase (AMP-forming)/AMP-acid ligase II
LTYRQLDVAADRAAQALLALGVGPGDRVAVALPNDVDIVVAFLGAMRLGVVWVGLPRVLARPEKVRMLADCDAALLLADPGIAEQMAPDGDGPPVRTVVVDPDDPSAAWSRLMAAAPPSRPAVDVDPFAPAAISYTSGTTGWPKGVVHSQHNLLMPGAMTVPTGGYGPDEPIGVVLPLTILNVMILNVVIAFQAGSRCVVGDRHDPATIAAWIEAEQVAVISFVPTIFHELLTHPSVRPEALRSVTKPRTGGAQVTPALRSLYQERFGTRLCSSFAMTEVPTFATREDPAEPEVPGSLGRALPHVRIVIVDADDRPVPAGTTGEICIAAAAEGPWAGVYTPMLGYWGLPEETARALRGGMLHTGDVGRLDDRGHLHLVDRTSSLIIRGGSNIYPAEIERVLHLDDRVADCAVVPRPDARLGETTVAFVELDPAATATPDELRDLCALHLARYKVPDEVRIVAQLPRNPLGKVHRAALAALLTPGD